MTVYSESVKSSIYLVELEWGNPAISYKVSNTNEKLELLDGIYLSDPALEIKLPVNEVGGKDDKASISMDTGNFSFILGITTAQSFPPMKITIKEYFKSESGNTTVVRFSGDLEKITRNPSGRSGVTTFHALGHRARMKVNLGITFSPHCMWAFTGKGCEKAVPTITGDFTITDGGKRTVDVLNITGLPVGPLPSYYFTNGSVEYDGHRIIIESWDGSNSFVLGQIPPKYWDTQEVTLIPGCNKTVSNCTFWENTQNFSGSALNANSRNPLFEVSGTYGIQD